MLGGGAGILSGRCPLVRGRRRDAGLAAGAAARDPPGEARAHASAAASDPTTPAGKPPARRPRRAARGRRRPRWQYRNCRGWRRASACGSRSPIPRRSRSRAAATDAGVVRAARRADPAQPVRGLRRAALPAGAAGGGGALVPGRDGAQGAQAVSRPGAAGRRGRARQDHRGRDGAEGIHAARHGRAHPDPDPGLAGRAVARRDGEQVRHGLRHQPRSAAAQPIPRPSGRSRG